MMPGEDKGQGHDSHGEDHHEEPKKEEKEESSEGEGKAGDSEDSEGGDQDTPDTSDDESGKDKKEGKNEGGAKKEANESQGDKPPSDKDKVSGRSRPSWVSAHLSYVELTFIPISRPQQRNQVARINSQARKKSSPTMILITAPLLAKAKIRKRARNPKVDLTRQSLKGL
jgi:hypothetical protein